MRECGEMLLQCGEGWRVAAESDAVGYQGGGDFGEGGVQGGFVDEESLDCVTGGWVGGLGIEKEREGHGDRGGFV